jgi:glycosyltransferase involved in cell wall biosynthesis
VVPGKASSEYLQAFGLSQKSIVTAPNAVDNNFFALESANARTRAAEIREKLKLPSRFILFVGRLVPEKGIFDLLSAYAAFEPDIRCEIGLVFAGDGISRAELALRAKNISPGMICFPGFAQREELAALYALAEVLVLPTHSDTWGLVVNEAMACGLPIMVSNIAGCAADLVENGWNGCLVPPHDEKALSGALRLVLCQPELRQSMAAHSLERIQDYSPEACAAGLAAAAMTSTET